MDCIEVVDEFLYAAESVPLIDVRSPSEFAQGHIPGAHNIPLFDDRERAIVGTTYVQVGRQQAIEAGVDLAYPKMYDIIQAGRTISPQRQILVHCWRGGMRSNAIASFFRIAGFSVSLLKGGYKAYRQHIHASFEKAMQLKIIGGLTGSGKTEVLQRLRERGEQVLDLELLANHRGSAFGGIGRIQPTTEQFENDIYAVWAGFDSARPIFVEDESLRIGRVVIPEAIYRKMRESLLIELHVSDDERLERVIRDYSGLDRNEFVQGCENIRKRLGLENLKRVLAYLHEDDFASAAAILLHYYDKTYSFSMAKRSSPRVICKIAAGTSIDEICAQVLAVAAADHDDTVV